MWSAPMWSAPIRPAPTWSAPTWSAPTWDAPTWEFLVGVGGFAETALRRVAPEARVVRLLHPSPASPAANRDWSGAAVRQLTEAGVWS